MPRGGDIVTQRRNSLMTASALRGWCALVLAFGGAGASALELGSAKLVSTPGAPIEIEVALLEVAAGELEALKPQIPASSRSSALVLASTEVGKSADGSPVLRIRSPSPTAGEDLRFVVVADWGRGRRFREYAISLNAPASSGDAVLTTTTRATSVAPTSGASVSASSTRIVRKNETLMSISREWSATTGVTLPQAMVGIYRANPGAFGPGGMSEMIVGSVLTLPDAAALKSTSAAEAASEISRVLGIWRTGGATAARQGATSPGVQTLTTAPPTPAAAAPAVTAPQKAASPTPAAKPEPPVKPEPTAKAEPPAKPEVPAKPEASPKPEAEATPAEPAAKPEIPAKPETPAEKAARLEAELTAKAADLEAATAEMAALKARLASSEAASREPAPSEEGWLGQAQRWASTAWWSIPALLLTSLILLIAFVVRGRRAAAAAEEAAAPRQEMTFDVPPIKPSRDADSRDADPLMDAVIRPEAERAAPVVVPSMTAGPPNTAPSGALGSLDDLEGDPPPVDEASGKINLARAFIEMGQHDAAILELQAALRLGDETQRAEAIRLLDSLPKS